MTGMITPKKTGSVDNNSHMSKIHKRVKTLNLGLEAVFFFLDLGRYRVHMHLESP